MRISNSKTQVGFRLSQVQADALALAAQAENATPGSYAKQAVLEKIGGGPLQSVLVELQDLHKELLDRIESQEELIERIQVNLAAFRAEFAQALSNG